ncbi:MAG: 3-phosphoserine/phosphohydroxythreonine transaminase [Legionella sp.]|uniref:3-phosphoserine/phosphohydroxythreonine transaminase n=1 Tax=Legionella sp. TaxID=459 RepID=UPI0039E66AEA
MITRNYNFGAGPAMLPESILREAQAELLDWNNTGMSVMEIGHRTPEFMSLCNHAEQTLRYLLAVPQNYQILFLGSAGRTQFSMIPMNLLQPNEQAGYLDTGIWSHMALLEAQNLKKAYCIASDALNGYTSIPAQRVWDIKENTTYVYFTPNETINGTRFPFVPKLSEGYLVADMTSCLLTEPININDYGVIFAGAQKNIANAGLTIVIIRNNLLERAPNPTVPSMMNYQLQAEYRSLYATPPTFNFYIAAKMFDWIKAQGGINVLYQRTQEKAAKIYQFLDSTDFYITRVEKEARSLVNICFSLKDKSLETTFLQQANQRGLYALKGHALVGGVRASMYNSMPLSGVDALIKFMAEFAKENYR